jgi:hypothetical protein
MKTAINRRIGYTVMWGLLAHVPLLSYAATNGTVVPLLSLSSNL